MLGTVTGQEMDKVIDKTVNDVLNILGIIKEKEGAVVAPDKF